MRQMRTIKQAITEIRDKDPATAITEHHLRNMILSGELASHKAGRKYLIDLAALEAVLCGEQHTPNTASAEIAVGYVKNKVRRIAGE